MYRIAMCEDERLFAEHHRKMLLEVFEKNGKREGWDYTVFVYYNLRDLEQALEAEKDFFDLLLMDIIMQDGNGMEFMKKMRKHKVSSSIIYISAYADFVFDSFETSPYRFLVKPLSREKLEEAVMKHFRETVAKEQQYLWLDSYEQYIRTEKIYYIEVIRHDLMIHLEKRVIKGKGPLFKVQEALPSREFCRCHVGYLINLSYVKELNRCHIKLDNNEVVPVSRRLYRKTKDAYLEFLLT